MLKILILCIIALVCIISIDEAFAQNSTKPVHVKIGIEVMNIGKVDKETGSYEMFFWVTETSKEYDFTKQPPIAIDYENG